MCGRFAAIGACIGDYGPGFEAVNGRVLLASCTYLNTNKELTCLAKRQSQTMKPYLTPDEVNSLYPVIGAVLYPGGLVVNRLSTRQNAGISHKRQRGEILYLSRRSRSKLLLTVSNNVKRFKSMLTLTYGVNYPMDGRQVKRDLNAFLTALRRVYPGVSYLWFLEFQRRGAPHMHILASVKSPSGDGRKWFAATWSNIACKGHNWPYTAVDWLNGRVVRGERLCELDAVRWWHSRPRAWSNIRKVDGAARYAAKYALKPHQKVVPEQYRNVGRFWGCSRDLSKIDGELVNGSEDEIREFLRLKGRDFGKYEVLPKICVYNGEISPKTRIDKSGG